MRYFFDFFRDPPPKVTMDESMKELCTEMARLNEQCERLKRAFEKMKNTAGTQEALPAYMSAQQLREERTRVLTIELATLTLQLHAITHEIREIHQMP